MWGSGSGRPDGVAQNSDITVCHAVLQSTALKMDFAVHLVNHLSSDQKAGVKTRGGMKQRLWSCLAAVQPSKSGHRPC